MEELISFVMETPPVRRPITSLEQWWKGHCALAERFASPIELAIAGGFVADRLGYAFGSGYQAAGAALLGLQATETTPTAFCATEDGSAHPKDIATTLTRDGDRWLMSGRKSFVTFGSFATRLLVVATEGTDAEGRNRLRLANIDTRPGVALEELPTMPFVPEIPHATVMFDEVAVSDDEVLEGDGYSRYLKPFRTVEDVHVHGALLGWLTAISRRFWPKPITERLLASMSAIHALSRVSPTSLAGHIALDGAMTQVRETLDVIEPHWEEVDEELRTRWERDRKLLRVAGSARAKRLEAAWRRLSGGE
jgi:hypothetical protein